jgi:hypothetical protein
MNTNNKKEEPTFASKFESKFVDLLIESSSLESKVKTYQQIIMSLLSTLRDCEDKKAHRSYLLTIRHLKDSSGDYYDFLDRWVE